MMQTATTMLGIEREGDILIVTPPMDVLDLDELQIEDMAGELLEFMDHTEVKDVVLDLHGIHPSDSQTQRLSVALSRAVRIHGRTMATCFI